MMTVAQSELRTYAAAVLHQNGVKNSRVWWPSGDVLALQVDPVNVAKTRKIVPIIELRAYAGVRIVIDEPGADLGPEAEAEPS
jgi:hypothetical protein